MQVNVTALNPVEVRFQPSNTVSSAPTYAPLQGDWVKQSIPFSYISLSATSLDNAAHTMQVYSDISASAKNVLNLRTLFLQSLQGGYQTLLVCSTM
jgi:hypothetical protein